MTKDEVLEHIYKQQDIFSKYNLNRDITDVVVPLLNDIAKVVSKIEPDKETIHEMIAENYERGFMEGHSKGVEETTDKACEWLNEVLYEGHINSGMNKVRVIDLLRYIGK